MSFKEDLKTGAAPYRQHFINVLQFLRGYFQNPIRSMQNLPDWEWPTLLIFYAGTAALCGTLAGIVATRLSMILAGLIVFPISATLGALIISGFFYYTFSFFFQKEVAFKTVFTIVALSFLPFFALYTLSGLVDPIKLVGFAVSSLLMTVGFSEHTQIDKRKIAKIIGSLYLAYFIFWAINMITWRNETRSYKDLATPETLEKLKEEFK